MINKMSVTTGLLAGGIYCCSAIAAAEKPNVIVVITDDQGYGDIAVHGHPFVKTPEMDRLHAESVRFTDFHVDPTCAPTRSALMTGKYSHRAGVWHTIAGGNILPTGQPTMAEVFKHSGYSTALFGKWHLGSNYPFRPMDRGFDEWLGSGDGGTGTTDDYFTNDRVNDHYLHNGEWEYREGFAPTVFFESACDYIKGREKDRPFFMYVSSYIPHSPWTVPDESLADDYLDALKDMSDEKAKRDLAFFLAGVTVVDENLGRLRRTLKEEGISDNTILIFMTDNGSHIGDAIYNAGMRGHKGEVYDGGHRVPFFVHWPAGNIAHGKDVRDLNAHFDVLPTLIDLCGLKSFADYDFDGRSFATQLTKPEQALAERTLFVEKQRTLESVKWESAAALTNRWRLVNDTELYDIEADPAQTTNVISEHPEVVKALQASFDQFWERVSPDDRKEMVVVAGHSADPELLLTASDWFLPKVPWNHQKVSLGAAVCGSWLIKAHSSGTYQFKLRRWPREADAPISGLPVIDKTVDSWDGGGAKKTLLYEGEKARVKALPVKFMRLTVGGVEQSLSVGSSSKECTFKLDLKRGEYRVKAEMLDRNKKVIAGAYYVYVRKLP